MKIKQKKYTLVTIIGLLTILLIGCSSSESSSSEEEEAVEIELVYVEWDTEIASTNVVAYVLENEGFKVKATGLDNAIMWEAVANNKADAMVAGWLPTSHKPQYEKNKDKLVELGVNLEGGDSGLVVPTYMDVDSIEDLKDEANREITGIEPGAGMMALSEQALKEYSNLEGWKLKASSSGAMNISLKQAIERKEEIVITGWTPHWIFNKYDLKILEDPKEIYGAEEQIYSFASQQLEEKSPKAFKILDQFYWTPEDMEEVMVDISEGTSPEDAAKKWVDANPDKVAEWTK